MKFPLKRKTFPRSSPKHDSNEFIKRPNCCLFDCYCCHISTLSLFASNHYRNDSSMCEHLWNEITAFFDAGKFCVCQAHHKVLLYIVIISNCSCYHRLKRKCVHNSCACVCWDRNRKRFILIWSDGNYNWGYQFSLLRLGIK